VSRWSTSVRSGRAGEEINLSLDEIAALHAAGADAHAIENAVRAVLLARYRAYRAKGLAGIASYARGGSATSASDELAASTAARVGATGALVDREELRRHVRARYLVEGDQPS
jgi:hypothetical protein